MLLILQHKDGRWCAPSIQDAQFEEGYGERWAEAVCETLGLPAGSLVPHIVPDDADPRTGELINEPVPPEPTPAPPAPDVHGFEQAGLAALGPIRANTLYAKWPLFLRALDRGDWKDARGLLDAALGAGDLTSDEHKTLSGLMTANAIP